MYDDYLLTFSSIEYIGFRDKYLLLKYFGSARSVIEASYEDLFFSGILKSNKAYRLSKEGLRNIDISNHIKVISIFNDDYPGELLDLYDPPVALYIIGEIPKLKKIAIVGSRECKKESTGDVYELAQKLVDMGYCIVSGMAKGIDSAAHWGALTLGKTIAVLGCGVDVCYPKINYVLKKKIEQEGCIISEYPPGKAPTKYSFPARNRIISGMSEVIIVAEAGEKSGALITAEFALEQGREVYVLGKPERILGLGTKALFNDGAPLISAGEFSRFL